MTGFIQRAPTRTNVLPAGVTIEQKPQAHPGKGTSVDTKPTWVASQGPRWKVAHTKTPGSPPPLAAQKHRLQANTAAKKSPTPPTAKPLPERSAVPQPAQKVKFEALCEAAHEKYSLKNRPEILSAFNKAGYDLNPLLTPKRILPENLVGDLNSLGAGALNQAYTGVFKTEDGKHMEVIIKFEQQYKSKNEMPELLMSLGVKPEDGKESSRNLAAKTLDTLLGWNNIVHTEIGSIQDPISQEHRVVTAMAKAEGNSGYGKMLGDKTVNDPNRLAQYTSIKNEIAQLESSIQRNLAQKAKIEPELSAIHGQINRIQEEKNKLGKLKILEKRKLEKERITLEAKAEELANKMEKAKLHINNSKQEIEDYKTTYHMLLASIRFYSEAGLTEIKNDKGDLIGLKGPQLGHNINPQDPKLKEELIKLQLQDTIMSQVDRHIGNYFIKTEPGGPDGKETVVGIQGIDNDQLGGTSKTLENYGNLKGLPPEIPSSVCRDIINLNPQDFQRQIECCLPKAEAEAATARLKLVKEHAQKVLDNNIRNGEGSLLPGLQYNYNNSYYMNFLAAHFPEEAERLANAA